MGRLFWKIFFGFWLTLTLSGAVIGVIVWKNNTARIQMLEELRKQPQNRYSLTLVARLMELEGTNFVQQLDQTNNFPVFIIDENGVDLLGQKLPFDNADSKAFFISGSEDGLRKYVTIRQGKYLLISKPRLKNGAGFLFNERPNRAWRLLWLLVFLAGGMFFSLVLTLYITYPIRLLRVATNQFAEGKLDTRIPNKFKGRKDEISGLASDFNSMAEKVQLVLNAQKNLVNDVSHELRSPLARLKLATELIAKHPDNTLELLTRVDKECNRFEELIDGFLTLAKTEIQYTDKADYFDINGLVENISCDAQFEASKKNIRVLFSNKEEILIYGNLEILHRAIENIIRNAVYYSPEHSEISIITKKHDRNVCLTVCDKGGGVTSNRLPDLFQPFFRVKDELQNSNTPGYGLGLAIAHRAIESHNGKIKAVNHDGGLCVQVSLPISPTS